MNHFVTHVIIIQSFYSRGYEKLDALASMFRGLFLMYFRIKTGMCEVQYLVIEAFDLIEWQVDGFRHFP